MKVFLSFTPVEGGCVIKLRTMIDDEIRASLWKRFIAWNLAGIAASQLQTDLRIMSNRIRPRKPIVQPTDGPVSRIHAWLKMFFSEGSQAACSLTNPCAYNNDW